MSKFNGDIAVGHVRYTTAGGNTIENVQPFLSVSHKGTLALVHNGQIVNAKELRCKMEDEGSIFQGTSDSEIVLHLIQRQKGSLLEKIQKTAQMMEGAFAILVMSENSIYAVRDKYGLRPLSYAKVQDGYCISSETCAYDVIAGTDIVDIKPGEIVKFSDGKVEHFSYTNDIKHCLCAMEYIYFSRPDSTLDGINVHLFRKKSGVLLAEYDKDLEAILSLVFQILQSVPQVDMQKLDDCLMKWVLSKSRYVARTFIQPTQELRDRGVRMKLSAIRSIVENKRIVLIDDSIVRGTTSKRIVHLLKEAGALEVHMRIASPMICSPCFYGVDTSTKEELIASRMNVDELKEYIQADSLKFLNVEDLCKIKGGTGLCTACFDKQYPTELYSYKKLLNKI